MRWCENQYDDGCKWEVSDFSCVFFFQIPSFAICAVPIFPKKSGVSEIDFVRSFESDSE